MAVTKKILIVSDSHGHNHNLWKILEKEKPYDILLHAGDYEDREEELKKRAGCEVYLVAGNNDYTGHLPSQQIIRFGSHKAILVHGHRHHLYAGLRDLYYSALEAEADYVIFGHIHKPFQETYNGITFLNPGSVTYPRQEDQKATYMTLEVDEKGNVEVSVHRM